MMGTASSIRLVPSGDARTRIYAKRIDSAALRIRYRQANPTAQPRRQRGIALIMALIGVMILTVMLADMHENTGTAIALASTQRDQLKAEYLARSSLNLTRLLIAQEPAIRQTVAPIYQAMIGRPPPQLPIWSFANEILQPFCNYDAAQETMANSGFDLSSSSGLENAGGTCEIIAFAENSRINVNDPLRHSGDQARLFVAMQFYGLIGGYQSPSPYDPLFEVRDADGLITTRLDIVSSIVDWWDEDTDRTVFDPGALQVSSAGTEDNPYAGFDDPYRTRNAPFDSLEELRLIRGVGDDFWATFIEPDPEDPTTRSITIYGSGSVNPNEAEPAVLLAQTCSIVPQTTLCANPLEAAKFIQLMSTVKMLAPLPWFSRTNDYLNFLRGRGSGTELYPMLRTMLGGQNELLFAPIEINQAQEASFHGTLVFASRILNVQGIGRVGNCNGEGPGRCTRVRIETVLNTDPAWHPPPPNAGTMPNMGIFHYWRIH